MIKNILIDFDSTIISCEIMEVLAEIALKNNVDKSQIYWKIQDITQKWMAWELPFSSSLSQRLELLTLDNNIIFETISYLEDKIVKSFKDNIDNLKKYNYHIISWWFWDVIYPLMKKFDVPWDRIHANKFIFEWNSFVWIDKTYFLSQNQGKVKMAKSLNLLPETLVIGDGYTDYEIKKDWIAQYFFYYAENVKRENVMELADKVVGNFDEIFDLIKNK